MIRRRRVIALSCALAALVTGGIFLLAPDDASEEIADPRDAGRPPRISPDYTGVTIPPNIAPLNFVVEEPGEKYRVRISAACGEAVEIFSRSPGIAIPLEPWRRLLDANRGGEIMVDVCVKAAGEWTRFEPLVDKIAAEEIDPCLVYREMPVYNLIWQDMGLYQRDLSIGEETCLLHNRSYAHGCMNCHTFLANRPEKMALNVRTIVKGDPFPGGMLVAEDGVVTRVVDTKVPFTSVPAIYLAWHPGGKAIAFSTNKVNQMFRAVGEERHSVVSSSDVAVYRLESNMVTTSDAVARPDRLETHPAWSADGSMLYFCSGLPTVSAEESEAEELARQLEIDEGKREGPVWRDRHEPYFPRDRDCELHYDLVRIRYDIEKDAWGSEVETVLTTDDTRPALCRLEMPPAKRGVLRSFAQPQVSPDGRYILLCLCAFGDFPIYQVTSDLYLLDLEEKVCRPLDEVNSDRSESWHSWSSNGRWIVFSSKRPVGLLARPWFAYIDEKGHARKPFILPQKDPAFYETCYRTFNRPELLTGPVELTPRQFLKALYSPDLQQKASLAPHLRRTEAETSATRTSN